MAKTVRSESGEELELKEGVVLGADGERLDESEESGPGGYHRRRGPGWGWRIFFFLLLLALPFLIFSGLIFVGVLVGITLIFGAVTALIGKLTGRGGGRRRFTVTTYRRR